MREGSILFRKNIDSFFFIRNELRPLYEIFKINDFDAFI